MSESIVGIVIGFLAWFVVRYLVSGIYTVNQNERAVKTSFGRAERIPGATTSTNPTSQGLDADEKQQQVVVGTKRSACLSML